MVKQIKTSITINADKEIVWNVLTKVVDYPKWNPFIKSISGRLKVGNQLIVKIEGMTFRPIVLTLDEKKELKWLGHLWFKGLFDGEHQFKLIDKKNGTTHFEQNERFSGVLVKLFYKQLEKSTKEGFERMNKELKKRVEEQLF
jgi:hypothetical protein